MPRHLEKRRRRWYAHLNIPKDLRSTIGRRRFLKSLETESLSVAEVKVLPVIAEWKKQIAIARGAVAGTGDELLDTIHMVRQDALRLKGAGVSSEDIKEAHEDVAYTRTWDADRGIFVTEYEVLADAVSVVHGSNLLLREHVEEYLASKDLAPKTADMQRRDIKLFSEQFQYAHNATNHKVRDWMNVTLGAEQNLSVGTRGRMLSAARGYWDYLEQHKGLRLAPPFRKVLPAKPKKKTKAMIDAQRKGFRVEDFHKLLSGCHDYSLTDLMTLAAYTGCRIEELCSLKLENVSEDRFEIINAKTEAGWRTIPIHSHISQTVARLVDTSSNEYLLSDLTFNKYGDRSNAIGKRFGRLKGSLGYGKDYVFHSFRKGFATQLENANVQKTVVARLMGHEIEGQTFGNYSDGLAFKGLREAISHLDWSAELR
jgi:integrase